MMSMTLLIEHPLECKTSKRTRFSKPESIAGYNRKSLVKKQMKTEELKLKIKAPREQLIRTIRW